MSDNKFFVRLCYGVVGGAGYDTEALGKEGVIKKFYELMEKNKPQETRLSVDRNKKNDEVDEQFDKNFNDEYRNLLKETFLSGKSFNEIFDKEYEFYKKWQNGKANQNNFFYNSIAKFKDIGSRPRRKPDYVSYTKYGDISSEYWYDGDTLIRGSNHWGYGIASCDWAIDSVPIKDNQNVTKTKKIYGKVKFDDIKFKSAIISIDDKFYFAGFDNVLEYTNKFKAYKFNGQIYVNNGVSTFHEYVKGYEKNGLYLPTNDKEEVERVRLRVEAREAARREKYKQELLNERNKIKERYKNNENIHDSSTNRIPRINDLFLTHDNKLIKIVGFGYYNDMKTVKLENGKEFVLRNIKKE